MTKEPKTQISNAEGVQKPSVWALFTTFVKIGSFTIGGGYVMIPLIQREVVERRGWIKDAEFIELLALAQAAPGVMAMNVAVFVGEKTLGWKGVAAAALGSILPSFFIILTIAMVFADFKENPAIERAFKGMRPAVTALIAAPLIQMARTVGLNWKNVFIPILAVVLIYFFHFNPAWTVLMAASGGILFSWFRKQ